MAGKPQPVRVLYCAVCSLPAEYCEFGPDFEKCKPWLIQNAPDLYPDLVKEANAKEADKVANQLQSTGISSGGDGAASSAPKQEEVKRLPGGKIKKKERQEVTIEKMTRNKRKCITTVKGLELFGVKLSDASTEIAFSLSFLSKKSKKKKKRKRNRSLIPHGSLHFAEKIRNPCIFSRENMSDALINGLAGAGGGIIAQLITYPLQTVNTRQQTERGLKKEKSKLGTIEQMLQVIKHEGWERLYGGLAPSLVGTAASQGVYYYFYQIFRNKAEAAALERRKIGVGDGSVGMLSSLVVAALSGCVNVLFTNPIWVVVTRMQTYKKNSKKSEPGPELLTAQDEAVLAAAEPPPFGTTHAIQEVYAEAGVLGFWRGVFPTLIMVSNPSMQFMLYETMLKKLKQRRALSKKDNSGVTALEIFLLGALAKLGATVVTYPLLVVKSRLQAKQVTTGDKRHHYKGTSDAILKMIRYEGLYGFYKGMGTKIVQSVLAAAVLFMIKEELVRGARFLLTNKVKSKPP